MIDKIGLFKLKECINRLSFFLKKIVLLLLFSFLGELCLVEVVMSKFLLFVTDLGARFLLLKPKTKI